MQPLQKPFVFKAHDSHINDLIFTLDGEFLLSAGMDNVTRLWEVTDWSLKHTFIGHQKSVNAIGLTSDGARMMTASSDCTIRLWDLGSGEEVKQFDIRGSSLRLSQDDRYLAGLDKPWLTIKDLFLDESLKRFQPFPKQTTALAFSPESDMFAVGGQGDDIHIYHLPGVAKANVIAGAHQGYVLSLAFSPDGKRLASTGYDGFLRFWDRKQFVLMGEAALENQGVQSIAYSSTGEWIAVASDYRVTLVDAVTMSIVQKVDLDPKGIYCLAFSPDDRWIACGSADKRLRIWRIKD